MPVVSIRWADGSTTHRTVYVRNDSGAATPQTPIVFLLHGAGGDSRHMNDPGASPGYHHDQQWRPPASVDFGWHDWPAPPRLYVVDPVKPVEGLEHFLARSGYRTVTYGQLDPEGLLRVPVLEFDAVFDSVRAEFPDAPVHLLCHSRGGLLARRWLATTRRVAPDTLAGVASVITLSSPHQGSGLADIQRFVDSMGASLLGKFTLGLWDSALEESVMRELGLVNNEFLAQLEADESALARGRTTPHPGIPLHALSGSRPRLARFHVYNSTVGSLIPRWHAPMFRWSGTTGNHYHGSPDTFEAVLPEEVKTGQGDVLVSIRRSVPATWAPTSTATFPVNHSSILWDGAVKRRVLSLLGGPLPAGLSGVIDSVTVPTLEPGELQRVTLVVRNTGQKPWGSSVRVTFDGAQPGVSWFEDVSPQPLQSVRLSHALTVPAEGSYRLRWRLGHADAGLFSEVVREVTASHTCRSLAAEAQRLEELFDAAQSLTGRARFSRLVALRRQQEAVTRRQRELRC